MRGRNVNEREFLALANLMIGLQEAGLTMAEYLAISGSQPVLGANQVNPDFAWQPLLAEAKEDDEDNFAYDANDADDEAFDVLPYAFILARQSGPVPQNAAAANLEAGLRASFNQQQPAPVVVTITDEDIIRSVIPYLRTELSSDSIGVFKENLNKLALDAQIEIIRYLIKKYAVNKAFKRDSRLERILEKLDDAQVLGSLEQAIKKIAQKDVPVSKKHLDQVKVALLETLRELEKALVLLKKPNLALKESVLVNEKADEEQKSLPEACGSPSSAGMFSAQGSPRSPVLSRRLNAIPGGSVVPKRFTLLTNGFEHLNVAEQKSTFLENLNDYLTINNQLGRAELLDLFAELKKPKGDFEFVHERKNPKWDRFRLLFKSNRNGPEEANFWHTKTFQAAVKILKEAYLDKPNDLPLGRSQEERQFIDYVRGNAPVHHSKTETRNRFSP